MLLTWLQLRDFRCHSALEFTPAPGVNLLLGGCASSVTQDVSAPGLVAQLSAQADAWDKAIVVKDRAAIEQNMAEDFRQIDGAGNIESTET